MRNSFFSVMVEKLERLRVDWYNLSYFKYKSKFEAMVIEKTVRKDISEKMTFRRAGCDYQNIVFNEEHHCGIWKMSKEIDGVVKDMGYEVVKGVKIMNPDGSIVYVYPSDKHFGVYGFYTYNLERCKEILDYWFSIKD